jgi:cysteine desulfurase
MSPLIISSRADLAAGSPQRLAGMRYRVQHELAHALPGQVRLNGHPDRRPHNTFNVSIAGVRGDELLGAASGLAASTGSARHSGDTQSPPVLSAMGTDPGRALSAASREGDR